MLELENSVSLYVPSLIGTVAFDSREAVIKDTVRFLSKTNGGATTFKARGAWIDNNGALVEEDVDVVKSFFIGASNIETIKAFAENLKRQLQQDSIALEHNGRLLLI